MGELLAAMLQAGGFSMTDIRRKGTAGEERTNTGYGGNCRLPEQEQIRKYSEAFYGLARLFQEMPCQKERLGDTSLQTVFQDARDLVCSRCGKSERCWGNDYFATCRMMYEMAVQAQEEGITAELVQEMYGQCSHADEVAAAITESFARARAELVWNNRILELRTAVGEQILQTARLMKGMSESFEEISGFHPEGMKKLKRNLGYLKIRLDNLRVFRFGQGRTEIFLTLHALRNVCVSAKTVAEILSDACGEAMCPARDCQAAVLAERSNFHFVQDTRYQLLCGISRMTKTGELVSGDNFAFLQKDTGQVVMSLADGMGSGVGACRESEKVIDLLEQFMEAGFPQEMAVRMMNACMLLQDQDQIFSTIDLCMVDLYQATCDMIKSGAAATFLVHGDEVEMIETDTFPAGVLWQSDYESVHRQLASGDVIIMMTDGVLEALPETEREETMKELIRKSASPNAREYARRLIERVYLIQKLQARDDMTVLVGSIWKK